MHLPIFSPRRLTGVAALACAAALIPVAALAATSSPPAPAAAARTPGCSTAGLVVWMNTQSDGAAGTFYYTLEFTNLSRHACTLRGHPGLSAVNLRGGQIGSPAGWGNIGNAKLDTVRLASGATATAVLAIADVSNYPRKLCHPVTAAGLRVYPPNQFASKVIPYPFRACSSKQVFMTAGVVQKQQ